MSFSQIAIKFKYDPLTCAICRRILHRYRFLGQISNSYYMGTGYVIFKRSLTSIAQSVPDISGIIVGLCIIRSGCGSGPILNT
jgi:hypothetical protein